ncbi:SdrD B-like domain-containing protein [Methylobacterium sp.]|uniref:SdrD B-like domain-containing protein n=1 Tax=Methylobacterium sp. TaxID=409 RepID=UPI0025D8A958|nr:SdrD B-like domain-containing protein [Methylobacterium sp.]MBY0256933.1 isopeptide-forming domain-containing fimbrial protein [Methylobacterium sp.]
MAPQPVVTVSGPASTFIGTNATYVLSFDNAASGAAVGYAPYIDVILPTNGADGAGVGNNPVNDGVTVVSATYLGAPVTQTTVTFDAAGKASHPFAKDASGNAIVVTGAPGDTLLVLTLPFGSFTTTQTPADVELKLAVSNLADLNVPLSLSATGGFSYGADPFNNPTADAPILGPAATATLTPTVATLDVIYRGPEQETATGPSYPRTWDSQAELAPGQTFTNFKIVSTLPDGVVLLGSGPNSWQVTLEDGNGNILPGTVNVTQNADGTTTVIGTFSGTITGGTIKPTVSMDWYVTEFLHDGTPVLDPSTGVFRPMPANASLTADWDPIDGRDPNPTPISIDQAGPEDIVTAKSIAIQKGVSLVNGDADANGVADWQPGGTLEYKLDGQVSNYFEMKDLVIRDTLGDGQTFKAGFQPTIVVKEGGATIYTGPVQYILGAKNADGTTPIAFLVSDTLFANGSDGVLDGNGGGLGAVPHATVYNQATVLVTFQTTLDENWVNPATQDDMVDQGDPVGNDVLYDGDVFLTDVTRTDDSHAGVKLPVNNVEKAIYSINGDTSQGTTSFNVKPKIQAGDLITYKLTLDIPLTSSHEVTLKDFLPLPVLKAGDPDANGVNNAFTYAGITNTPGVGQWSFMTTDQLQTNAPGAIPGITVTQDPTGNSILWDFGDITNSAYPRTKLELLFTVRVNDEAFGDGLLLTNQVTSSEENSFNEVFQDNAIIQFVLGEPRLKITKGVVAEDNTGGGVFLNATTNDASIGPAGVTWNGKGAATPFSGTITSSGLAAKPVDANLFQADARDTVTFAIVLENVGSGPRGAFDTLIKDTIPAGFTLGAVPLNLKVVDGTGAAVAYTGDPADIFTTGIELVDPGARQGAIGAYDPTSGKNIVVITYDLRIDDNVQSMARLTNTATTADYAAEEGGINRTSTDSLPDTNSAFVEITPKIGKTVIATSNSDTGTSEGNGSLSDLAIGEEVTWRVTVTVPEGISKNLTIRDILPGGAGAVTSGKFLLVGVTDATVGGNITGFGSTVGTITDSNGDGINDTVTFSLGNVTNAPDNVEDAKDTVTFDITARVLDDASNRRGDVDTNKATVSVTDPSGSTKTTEVRSSVEIVEPVLDITKTVNPTTADAGDTLTYTVTLTNTSGSFRAPAYEVSIDDLLAQLPPNAQFLPGTVTLGSGQPAGTTIVTGNGAGDSTIKVTTPKLTEGQSVTFTFKAVTTPGAISGQTIPNEAVATGTSMPGTPPSERSYTDKDDATVTLASPGITKTVTATSFADTGSARFDAARQDVKVNEVVTYTLVVTLPEGQSVNFRVIDKLADSLIANNSDGLLQYIPGSAQVVSVGANLSKVGGGSLLTPTVTPSDTNGNGINDQLRLDFGTILNAADNVTDAKDRITIQIQARAADVPANQNADVLVNRAQAFTDFSQSSEVQAAVDFVQPELDVQKTTSFTTGDAGDLATYTITIRHTANSSANAYNMVLGDLLAPGLQLVAGSATTSFGSISTAGGKITLTAPAYTLGSQPITITYQARLLDDVVHNQAITNVAKLTYDTDSDPTLSRQLNDQDDATIGVRITDTVEKTITATDNPYTTGTNVAVGETVTYRIKATLGEGKQGLVITDAMQTGLEYVSSKVVSTGGNVQDSTLLVNDPGSYNAGTNTVSFNFGAVTNLGDNVVNTLDTVVVEVVAKVASGTGSGTNLLNTATLSPTIPTNPYGVPPGPMPPSVDTKTVTVVSATVGNFAFEDQNGDGIQQGTEPGVQGVVVQLRDMGGNIVASQTTGSNGLYLFTNVVPGQYYETFVKPAGWEFTKPLQGGNPALDSDGTPVNATTAQGPSFTLTNGQTDLTRDIGLYRPASLGDKVWEDLDGDGTQDGNEPGIANIEVKLYDASNTLVGTVFTNGVGEYQFANLRPGDYTVQFGKPAGYVFTAKDATGDAADSDANPLNGLTGTINLVSGENDTTVDAGLYKPVVIGDRVWEDLDGDGVQDLGEPGIQGVKVKLLDGSGNQVGTDLATDANGNYQFTGLKPGQYAVQFVKPSGFDSTVPAQGGNPALDSDANQTTGRTPTKTYISGDIDLNVDGGFYKPVSLGDRLWLDANGNGVQDDGEQGVTGQTVNLYDGSGNFVTSAVTGANGFYNFTGLRPGTYTVEFTKPVGYWFTQPGQGGNPALDSNASTTTGKTAAVTLASGQSDMTIDAGIFQPVTIGDRAWVDTNGNGIQDGSEPGLKDVEVKLINVTTGQVVGTAMTDANGAYSFTVAPGTYKEVWTAPGAYVPTLQGQGGNPALDSNVNPVTKETAPITLSSGQSDPTQDGGFYIPVRIGDTVFEDQNGNGIQDGVDTPLQGVTVNLYDGAGNFVATTTTGANGKYEFNGLRPNTYQVEFVEPAGFTFTTPDAAGSTDANDSDANTATGRAPARTYVSGDVDLSIDAGLWRPVTIGNYAWLDHNGNGIQDGNESPLAGVTVKLYDAVTGALLGTQTTGANGLYLFTGLKPGTFREDWTAPTGYVFTRPDQGNDDALDSDVLALAQAAGSTANFNVWSGQTDLTRDAGLLELGSISGRVFKPVVGNLCDGRMPDSVFGGVTVNLLDANGNVVKSTVTAEDGTYKLGGVVPGTYTVQFVKPDGTAFIPQVAGTNSPTDSDANPANGVTPPITVTSGEHEVQWNAGVVHLTGTVLDGGPTVTVTNGGASLNGPGSQVIQVLGSASINLNTAGNLVLGGQGDLTVSSNQGGQYLVGGAGNNILHMGPNGGGVAIGGKGTTIVEGTAGNDIIIGGCGENNVQGLGTNSQGLGGWDLIVGGNSNDILEGNHSSGYILGGGGDDRIHAAGSNVYLHGGTNNGRISFAGGQLSGLVIGDHVNATGPGSQIVWQKGDGVQWIENFNPAGGDRINVYGYAAPTQVGTVNGFTVLYFGENEALVFNGAAPASGINYVPSQTKASGPFGDFQPLAPVVLGPSVTTFFGTSGDDIAVASANGTRFQGNAGNDAFFGNAGHDVFVGGAGSDLFRGGDGLDKAVYSFAYDPAKLAQNSVGDWVLQKPAGADLLQGVEQIQFANGLLNLTNGSFNPAALTDPDYDGDGKADLLFLSTNGSVFQWKMNGAGQEAGAAMAHVGAGWRVAAQGDLDADGKTDVVWRNDAGGLYLWKMDGLNAPTGLALADPGADWQVAGSADFDGDGKFDLLWRHTDGSVFQWQMDGGAIKAMGGLGNPGLGWTIAGVGDFGGDGRADILWTNGSGDLYLWNLDGTSIASQGSVGNAGAGWAVAGVGDFNGDGRTDVVFRNADGLIYQWQMNGSQVVSQGAIGTVGSDWRLASVDDFNGDGKTDLIWQNGSGTIWQWTLDGLSVTGNGAVGQVTPDWLIV